MLINPDGILNKILHEYKDKVLKEHIISWFNIANKVQWGKPQDVKNMYPKASIIKNNRVVFNIYGNKFRLIVEIKYEFKIAKVVYFGTHQEYDKIDANTISKF